MANPIHLAQWRDKQLARREPYWGPSVGDGKHLGFRKLEDGTGTWVARFTDEQFKRKYEALGQVTQKFGYNDALKAAEPWFKDRAAGVGDDDITIEGACKEYVEGFEADGHATKAKNCEYKLKPHIYETAFGRTKLAKVKTLTIKKWRNALSGGAQNKDRVLRQLKAAVHAAVINRRVPADVMIEFQAVKPLKKKHVRRELYLDVAQRHLLIDAVDGEAGKNLVRAAALTGARPGELAALTRESFDTRTKVLVLERGSKEHERKISLSGEAAEFFAARCENKLPKAPLLPDDDGGFWAHPKRWGRKIEEARAREPKLPKKTVMYTLRHSWITDALRAGNSTLDVARFTGTSLQMIEEHYGHLVEDAAIKIGKVKML